MYTLCSPYVAINFNIKLIHDTLYNLVSSPATFYKHEMSAWVNPDTHIEHDAHKRAAAMTKYKTVIKSAESKLAAGQMTQEDYVVVSSSTRLWAARTDFISAALDADKTDAEIQEMLVPANECPTEHGSTAIFKALIVALGGELTDLSISLTPRGGVPAAAMRGLSVHGFSKFQSWQIPRS